VKRRFRPAPILGLALLLLLPLFLVQGFWQLQRAEEKRRLQEEYDRRATAPVMRVEPRLQQAEDLRFHRVVARGYYDARNQVLIGNRVHAGRVGYHVITPLRIEGGEVRVLVNRGWVPQREDGAPPPIDVPAGLVEAGGIATAPAEKPLTLGWTRSRGALTVWPHLDMRRYAELAPFAVQPVLILLNPGSPGGFAREWSRLDAGIAMHEGYAYQWFVLAGVLLVVYLVITLRRAERDDRTSENEK